jgi:hypothetical protein
MRRNRSNTTVAVETIDSIPSNPVVVVPMDVDVVVYFGLIAITTTTFIVIDMSIRATTTREIEVLCWGWGVNLIDGSDHIPSLEELSLG